jgi:hypothetical protein
MGCGGGEGQSVEQVVTSSAHAGQRDWILVLLDAEETYDSTAEATSKSEECPEGDEGKRERRPRGRARGPSEAG